MNVRFLSSKELDSKNDYGDCIIINDNGNVIVYDCGSEEFADEVLKYLDENNIGKIDIVLSHNDSDHFKGIPKLVEKNRVKSITTLLLLKHIDDICEVGGFKNKEAVKRKILKLYDNISQLSGNNLIDAVGDDVYLSDNIKVVGPDEDYFLEAVAKHLDDSESDVKDGETIMNAISVQLELNYGENKLLLTGDANYEALKDKIREYDAIQLPHHGKDQQAEDIFEKNHGRNQVKYLVSDNKGNNNGGSDNLYKLPTSGYIILNTKDGEINFSKNDFGVQAKGNLYEIYSIR